MLAGQCHLSYIRVRSILSVQCDLKGVQGVYITCHSLGNSVDYTISRKLLPVMDICFLFFFPYLYICLLRQSVSLMSFSYARSGFHSERIMCTEGRRVECGPHASKKYI